MPEHYNDWWWEDLPEKAKRAAAVLQYDKESWDEDKNVPYDDKAFVDCTMEEKRAATFLHFKPIEKKLDPLWWSDTDEETKKHAAVLGWDQEKWDDDWAIHDLPCEHWHWNDMTDEQKAAAQYFGYCKSTWDETDDYNEDEDFVASVPVAPKKKKKQEEQTKYEEETDESEGEEEPGESHPDTATTDAAAKKEEKKAKKKAMFTVSKEYGGDGGGEFDHHNNRSIEEITVHASGHCVNGITVKYFGNNEFFDGTKSGNDAVLKLSKGEYVNTVKVRSNKLVQWMVFETNKGQSVGGGGKGWKLPGMDKEGTEVEVHAPSGCQLCGVKGRGGKHIYAIAFRWGPIPGSNKSS